MSKLKNVKVLTAAAMLLAISVILSFFKISITEVLEIRFSNLPVAVAGMLFGPGVGGAVGALSDILGYVVRPTGPYFPGFTVSAALSGAIFGFVLREKRTLARIILACVLYEGLVGVLLTAVWLHVLYSTPLPVLIAARIPKELVMLAFHVVVLTFLVRPALEMTRLAEERKRL